MSATKDESKNGTWRYQKVVRNPNTGERISLKKRGFKTKREAEAAEALAISNAYACVGITKIPFTMLINDFIEFKTKRTNTRSVQKTQRMLTKFILPNVGTMDMTKYSSFDARNFYDKLLDFPCSDNQKNAILELFKALFRHAEIQFNMKNNPVNKLQKFKVKKVSGYYNVYSIMEFERFNSTFSEKDDYEYSIKLFFNVLLWTGVRRGECKGLRWNDIDFESNLIQIDEQFIDKDPIKGRMCDAVKTLASNRKVLADDVTMEMIRKLYEKRKQDLNFSQQDFIFLRKNSDIPFADNTIDHRNRVHSKLAGIKKIRIHDFRHSFTSINYSLGADIKTISQQLGHSSLSMTLDIYVNMFQEKNVERVDLLNVARKKAQLDLETQN